MTNQATKAFLKRLRAAYPNSKWDRDVIEAYRDHLGPIPDQDSQALIRMLVADHPSWLPTVGEILVAHKRLSANTMRPEHYSAPPSEGPSRIMWLRQTRQAAERGDLFDWNGNPIRPEEVPYG